MKKNHKTNSRHCLYSMVLTNGGCLLLENLYDSKTITIPIPQFRQLQRLPVLKILLPTISQLFLWL